MVNAGLLWVPCEPMFRNSEGQKGRAASASTLSPEGPLSNCTLRRVGPGGAGALGLAHACDAQQVGRGVADAAAQHKAQGFNAPWKLLSFHGCSLRCFQLRFVFVVWGVLRFVVCR